MSFGAPEFLYLAAAAPLLLLAVAILQRALSRKRLARFADHPLLPSLLAGHSPARTLVKNILLALSFALLFTALAQPRWGFKNEEQGGSGGDIVIAVDVSRSMLAQDVLPSRLERAKFAVLDLVDKLGGDRVGIVAFAGTAFLQCPLTPDHSAVRQSVEALDTDTIPLQGTNVASAISEAIAAYPSNAAHRTLILITDGEDLEEDGLKRAEEAGNEGVLIHTIGVGDPAGTTLPDPDRPGQALRDHRGQTIITKLDETTLKRVAELTGGTYRPLGTAGDGLESLRQDGLNNLEQSENKSTRSVRRPIERFHWPLAAALGLLTLELLVNTRRKP